MANKSRLTSNQIKAIMAKSGVSNNRKATTKNKKSSSGATKKRATAQANTKQVSNETVNQSISAITKKVGGNEAIEKSIKKMPLKSKICILVLFFMGVAISFLACFLICRNDCFKIIGSKNITIFVNDTYTDEGVKAIAFSKDIKDEVIIEIRKDGVKKEDIFNLTLDTSSECVYEIIYKLNNFRFRNIQIVRTIYVVHNEIVTPEEDAYSSLNKNTQNKF